MANEKVSQREYARRLKISHETVSRAVRDKKIKKGWDEKVGKIIVKYADEEFGNLFKEENIIPQKQNTVHSPTNDFPREPANVSPGSGKVSAQSSYADIKKWIALKELELKNMDVEERKGKLVSKERVYKQLFDFGQQMRDKLFAIPDRSIDNLMACKDRGEAHILLTGAIHEVLETLSNQEFNF